MNEKHGPVGESGAADARLRADRVRLGYRGRTISDQLSVEIPDGAFTVVIGPNACGKSTLLRALARLLTPESGAVLLDGKPITAYPPKEVARRIGLLPQSSTAPDGIRVADLVARGRYPHQSLLRQWSRADEEAVAAAMAATGVTELSARAVDELSGGQRQRVWIAMVLAQDTPVILLDEPTTYLDIAHQIQLLDLCRSLQRDSGRTVVAVLHDLNHAFRYADHLVAMKEGRVVAAGAPREIVTAELVQEVFDLGCRIVDDPETGAPLVVPLAEHAVRVL
ncbi:ABC transporter ATP-binding protein [Nocardia mexicana]|uniref:Iron complex transport system ATP-binding protein n=1 Tax=Nocardia mexicana TaxID=279262 RepID=A0A370H3F1_9NOCA|nr:ABC transporter ATP-binding protein [Nocardia mexicana]RDI50184.1 iron complex transport system ATP-binding protein [Nocardia mexicana]